MKPRVVLDWRSGGSLLECRSGEVHATIRADVRFQILKFGNGQTNGQTDERTH